MSQKLLNLSTVACLVAAVQQAPADNRNLIVYAGPSGTGKTSAGMYLVGHHQAAYVCSLEKHLSHVRGDIMRALGLYDVATGKYSTGRRRESAYQPNSMIIESLRAKPRLLVIDEAGQMSPDTLTVIRGLADHITTPIILLGEAGYGTLSDHDLARKVEAIESIKRRAMVIKPPALDNDDIMYLLDGVEVDPVRVRSKCKTVAQAVQLIAQIKQHCMIGGNPEDIL